MCSFWHPGTPTLRTTLTLSPGVSECRMSKITNVVLTPPVWLRMLYSCTHMATVGVKGLIWCMLLHLRRCVCLVVWRWVVVDWSCVAVSRCDTSKSSWNCARTSWVWGQSAAVHWTTTCCWARSWSPARRVWARTNGKSWMSSQSHSIWLSSDLVAARTNTRGRTPNEIWLELFGRWTTWLVC